MAAGNRTHPPPWPSLYDASVEILHIEHRDPVQPDGAYLYRAEDIFRFTLYWTLIFYTPMFIVCGLYAFWNLNFPPSPHPFSRQHYHQYIHPHHDNNAPPSQSYPLSPITSSSLSPRSESHELYLHRVGTRRTREKERRSRLAFSLIVLLTFLILSVAGAVIGSAILGFATMGLYRAADFNMSTWIPFLLALLQVLVGLLSIWPSIIDLI